MLPNDRVILLKALRIISKLSNKLMVNTSVILINANLLKCQLSGYVSGILSCCVEESRTRGGNELYSHSFYFSLCHFRLFTL